MKAEADIGEAESICEKRTCWEMVEIKTETVINQERETVAERESYGT